MKRKVSFNDTTISDEQLASQEGVNKDEEEGDILDLTVKEQFEFV